MAIKSKDGSTNTSSENSSCMSTTETSGVLSPDEHLAKLQSGEMVLSRHDTASLFNGGSARVPGATDQTAAFLWRTWAEHGAVVAVEEEESHISTHPLRLSQKM